MIRVAFLLVIKAYWFLKPKNSKPKCIYAVSCSHHIYNVVDKQGAKKGLQELRYRIKNCRPGYILLFNKQWTLLTAGNEIINEKDIAKHLIKN